MVEMLTIKPFMHVVDHGGLNLLHLWDVAERKGGSWTRDPLMPCFESTDRILLGSNQNLLSNVITTLDTPINKTDHHIATASTSIAALDLLLGDDEIQKWRSALHLQILLNYRNINCKMGKGGNNGVYGIKVGWVHMVCNLG